jgi:hypothetical protein
VELPPEATVRSLLEAAQVEDLDQAITDARADGDVFEGDEIATGEEVQIAAGGRLVEAVGKGETPGTTRYQVVVARPGRAQGHGRRYYSQRMLEANAPNFGGQPMFWNHEDLDVILKRGHGSRDPRDLCGWLQEATWYDPTFTEPDDKKEGRLTGAVMGHADVDDGANSLLKKFPKALGLSINMDSTKIRVGRTEEGELAPLVEGVIKGSGSLDVITGKAGAGGKVLERLRESAERRYGSGHADLAALDDDRLIEAVRQRPAVLDRLREADPDHSQEDRVSEITGAKLIEAVQGEGVADQLVEALAGTPSFDRVVEAKVQEREDSIRDDARAEGRRELDLRDMRDEADRHIEARSRERGGILTPTFVEDLRGRYELRTGGVPSAALDLHDELNDDGSVKRPAIERLREAVDLDIKREEAKLREAAPTLVRDLAPPEPELDDEGNPKDPPPPKDPLAEELGLDAAKVREHQGV